MESNVSQESVMDNCASIAIADAILEERAPIIPDDHEEMQGEEVEVAFEEQETEKTEETEESEIEKGEKDEKEQEKILYKGEDLEMCMAELDGYRNLLPGEDIVAALEELNSFRKNHFKNMFLELHTACCVYQEAMNNLCYTAPMQSFRRAIIDLPVHYVEFKKYNSRLPFGPYDMSLLGLPCTYNGDKWMCSQFAADKFIEIWGKNFQRY